MRIPVFFILLFCLSASILAHADDDNKNLLQPRILIILDASSSMVNDWSAGNTRYDAASKIILRLMDSIYSVNNQVEFALRVIGHQSTVNEQNCFDTKLEVYFSKDNYAQMELRLKSIRPLGVTPLAFALKDAAENDLINLQRNTYSIILITDGGESCGGDICKTAHDLLERKINFKPYIIGLVDYAPLKDAYACLGKYLQITKPADISPNVSFIINSYRPLLTEKKIIQSKPIVAKPIVTLPDQPKVDYTPPPVVLPKGALALFAPRQSYSSFPVRYAFPPGTTVRVPPFVMPRFTSMPDVQPPIVVTPITKPVVNPKDTTHINTKPSVVIKPNTVKPFVKKHSDALPPPKEASFMAVTEDAKETLTEIYFTNGKGKFYTTMPQLALFNPKTGKEVMRFYRTVSTNGTPDVQKIPAGNYNIGVVGSNQLLMRNLTIMPSKLNKIIVKVTTGSLHFYYETDNDRPVEEFTALVTERTGNSAPTIKQRASVVLEYEPGNYHLELNTLPRSVYNVDINFGMISDISVPEPGYVQFVNTDPIGTVSLFYPLGDQYVRFYNMDVTGNLDVQRLMLKPGPYEAHWKKNPKLPYASETIVKFVVKSNSTTEVELR